MTKTSIFLNSSFFGCNFLEFEALIPLSIAIRLLGVIFDVAAVSRLKFNENQGGYRCLK